MKSISNIKSKTLSFFGKKAYQYNDRKYQDKLCSKYNSPYTYLSIFNLHNNYFNINTDVKIAYDSNIDFGSSTRDVKRSINLPYIKVKSNRIPNCEILYYKLLVGKIKTKLEMHFIDDELFFFNYQYTTISRNTKHEILKLISTKYNSGNELNTNIISDNEGNFIYVDDKFDLTVNYISKARKYYKYFIEVVNNEKQIKADIREESLRKVYSSI